MTSMIPNSVFKKAYRRNEAFDAIAKLVDTGQPLPFEVSRREKAVFKAGGSMIHLFAVMQLREYISNVTGHSPRPKELIDIYGMLTGVRSFVEKPRRARVETSKDLQAVALGDEWKDLLKDIIAEPTASTVTEIKSVKVFGEDLSQQLQTH